MCSPMFGITDYVAIVALEGFPFLSFEEGIKVRVIVLEDVRGETVTIDFGAGEPTFDGFAPEGQKVVYLAIRRCCVVISFTSSLRCPVLLC
jgi:hypothetical protein